MCLLGLLLQLILLLNNVVLSLKSCFLIYCKSVSFNMQNLIEHTMENKSMGILNMKNSTI